MLYFSKARLGEMYEENGWKLVVKEVSINKEKSYITSYSRQTSPSTIVNDIYPETDYLNEKFLDEKIKSVSFQLFHIETKFNIGDGVVDASNGKFYEITDIRAYYYFGQGKELRFVYSLKDVCDRIVSFDEDILLDYVDNGVYKYLKINKEEDDFIEEDKCCEISPFNEY